MCVTEVFNKLQQSNTVWCVNKMTFVCDVDVMFVRVSALYMHVCACTINAALEIRKSLNLWLSVSLSLPTFRPILL